jgi:hypothetical protein
VTGGGKAKIKITQEKQKEEKTRAPKNFEKKNLCTDFSIGKIISFLFTNWLENFNMNFATVLPISERSSESVRQKFYEIICNLIYQYSRCLESKCS